MLFMIQYAILATVNRSAVVALAWMCGLAALAQSPGKFVAIGSMTARRAGHTATLLRDGRVLIAGGQFFDPPGILASAEIYDLSTGTFTPTGDMSAARADHAAALLPDGRVLIVGNYASQPSSADIFDPTTGVFTAIGNMAGLHEFPVANLLNSGKVLITGSPSAEIYDPATSVFTLLGPLDDGARATLLEDGQVLLSNYNNVSLYNITADSLQLVARLANDGAYWTTTRLPDGKFLIAGGWALSGIDSTSNEASLYDPHTRTVDSTGLLLFSRVKHTATSLPGGRILIVGGYNGDGYDTGVPVLWDAEQYDPSTGSFSAAGTLGFLRSQHTATLLPDGTVLITGGVALDNPPAELYIPPLRAVSSASLTGPMAPESQASLFGSRLAGATETGDSLSPPTNLGGISLRVVDGAGTARMAPLFRVSPTRIDFEVPAGTVAGKVTLEVVNAPSQAPQTAAQINNIAPALFTHDDNTVVAYTTRFGRRRIPFDNPPVQLILYATGIRNRSSLANVQCTIGGISVPVESAGPNDNGVPGLDQVNVSLIPVLKGGFADLVLTVDGIPSNTVSVYVPSPRRE